MTINYWTGQFIFTWHFVLKLDEEVQEKQEQQKNLNIITDSSKSTKFPDPTRVFFSCLKKKKNFFFSFLTYMLELHS